MLGIIIFCRGIYGKQAYFSRLHQGAAAHCTCAVFQIPDSRIGITEVEGIGSIFTGLRYLKAVSAIVKNIGNLILCNRGYGNGGQVACRAQNIYASCFTHIDEIHCLSTGFSLSRLLYHIEAACIRAQCEGTSCKRAGMEGNLTIACHCYIRIQSTCNTMCIVIFCSRIYGHKTCRSRLHGGIRHCVTLCQIPDYGCGIRKIKGIGYIFIRCGLNKSVGLISTHFKGTDGRTNCSCSITTYGFRNYYHLKLCIYIIFRHGVGAVNICHT